MKKFILGAFIIILVSFFLYSFNITGELFFDDEHFILNNHIITDFSFDNIRDWLTKNSYYGAGRSSDYYRPLLIFTFAVNYLLGGYHPIGYHIFNILLHSFVGVLVFYVLFKYVFKKYRPSFLVSIIFAIHPMQSENVAYISGRGDLLSSIFMLASLIFWIKSLDGRFKCIFFSCLSLVLALLSRENAIVLPFLLIVFYMSFLTKESFLTSFRRVLLKVLPHILIVGLYFVLRLTVLNFRNFLNFGNYEVGTPYYENLSVRLFTFCHVLWEYIRNIFWPTNVYEKLTFSIHHSFFDLTVWTSFVLVVSLFAFLCFLYSRSIKIIDGKSKKNNDVVLYNNQHYSVWFFGLGWFFVNLVPSSGILPTNTIIQDHRVYLAMVGVFSIIFFYLDNFFLYLEFQKRNILYLVYMLLIAYIVFISSITLKRVILWGKPIELFEETISKEPNALSAYNQLGRHYILKGDYLNARKNLLIAVEKGARFPQPYYNLGQLDFIYSENKNYARAEYYYIKSLEFDKNFAVSYRRLAELYMKKGSSEAVFYLKKALEFFPDDPNIYYNLSLVLHFLGNDMEALDYLDKGGLFIEENLEAKRVFADLRNRIISNDLD